MKIIGLTGGIASGKSTVSGMLRELGAMIVDTDVIAREVVEPGQPAWEEIVAWLGRGVLQADGRIDRQRLGDMVFADREARGRLESITHPRIAAAVDEAVAAAEAAGARAVVLDVPLLFEVGWDERVDEVWVVAVDSETQLTRLMARDGSTEEQARARIASQMSLAAKIRRADVAIDNGRGIDGTRVQVQKAWQKSIATE